MKRKIVIVVLFFMSIFTANSQELEVIDFKQTVSPLAVRFPEYDVHNDPCGLVKIGLPIPEAEFPDALKSKYKKGEWWVYMTKGSKWITIKTPLFPPFHYDFADSKTVTCIDSNVTYEMTIKMPNTSTIKNSSALLRSAFVPGWGQFYKSRNGRGTLIIIGETLSLAAGGLSLYNELTQKSIMDKPEVSYQDYIAAEKSYEQWNTARHISFITAAVIYGLNLVDAYLTPAKPSKSPSFAPNVMNVNGEMAVGASLSIKF